MHHRDNSIEGSKTVGENKVGEDILSSDSRL